MTVHSSSTVWASMGPGLRPAAFSPFCTLATLLPFEPERINRGTPWRMT